MTQCTSLSALPENIGLMQACKTLCLFGCASLTALPDSVGQMLALKKLDLRHCASLTALSVLLRCIYNQ